MFFLTKLDTSDKRSEIRKFIIIGLCLFDYRTKKLSDLQIPQPLRCASDNRRIIGPNTNYRAKNDYRTVKRECLLIFISYFKFLINLSYRGLLIGKGACHAVLLVSLLLLTSLPLLATLLTSLVSLLWLESLLLQSSLLLLTSCLLLMFPTILGF
jgi:hypothetical protein